MKERKNGTYDKNKYLFIGRQGIEENKFLHRTTINAIINKYAELSKICIHPHLFRHYFCTQAHRTKALTEIQIASLAGHSSVNTTKKYIKLDIEDLIKKVNSI